MTRLKRNQIIAVTKRRAVTLCTALMALGIPLSISTVPAYAFCNTNGQSDTIFEVWGEERSQSAATCDNDNVYRGFIADLVTDGSCVWVIFQDNNIQRRLADSCNSAGINYTFTDPDCPGTGCGNTILRLCRLQGCGFWKFSQGY